MTAEEWRLMKLGEAQAQAATAAAAALWAARNLEKLQRMCRENEPTKVKLREVLPVQDLEAFAAILRTTAEKLKLSLPWNN